VQTNEVLTELFGRLPDLVHRTVEGLDAETLCTAPRDGANTIGWLVWHLTRVQDHHLAGVLETEQIWVTDNWGPRFGLLSDPDNTGYGHKPADVAAVLPDGADALVGYFDAVFARTNKYLAGLTETDLDRVVDERWDPPVTLGVRLVSVACDDLEHVGQAAYLRGLSTN